MDAEFFFYLSLSQIAMPITIDKPYLYTYTRGANQLVLESVV
jgi:hypothetical protein